MDMLNQFLEGCREEFDAGNRWALMQAIWVCALENSPLPKWAACAYIKNYEAVRTGRAKSWDEVFGRPYPKGTHHHAVSKRHEIQWPLFRRVEEIIAAEPATAVDGELFERVGKEFNIGKTLASELYYDAKRKHGVT